MTIKEFNEYPFRKDTVIRVGGKWYGIQSVDFQLLEIETEEGVVSINDISAITN